MHCLKSCNRFYVHKKCVLSQTYSYVLEISWSRWRYISSHQTAVYWTLQKVISLWCTCLLSPVARCHLSVCCYLWPGGRCVSVVTCGQVSSVCLLLSGVVWDGSVSRAVDDIPWWTWVTDESAWRPISRRVSLYLHIIYTIKTTHPP